MNKTDLVQLVKNEAGLSSTQAEKAVATLFAGISAALAKKEDVSFIGFGTFTVTKREARDGHNPRTKEKIKIPATNQVKFKAGKSLKENVNQ